MTLKNLCSFGTTFSIIFCYIQFCSLFIVSVESVPQVSVRKGRQVHVDCLGENIQLLTAVACATPNDCREKKAACIDDRDCALERGKEVFVGSPCYHDNGQGSCYSIDMEPLITAGLIECQSWNGHRVVDHFFYGVDGEFHLASNPPKASLIALQLSSLHGDARGTGQRGDALELYKSEPVNGKCVAPEFTSVQSSYLEFMGIRKDGSKFPFDCNCVTDNNVGGLKSVSIRNYFIPDDVTGFYCAVAKANRAAKSTNYEEDDIVATVINVTVWNK